MATANNTIKTRIQLKSDTEENWNKLGQKDGSNGFIPLNGEIIIYSTDNTHNFSRVKIGDGQTNIVNLPFVDAGSLKGNEEIIYKYDSFNNFPQTGSISCLYLDKSTSQLYHYDTTHKYKPISGASLNATTDVITEVLYWGPGSMTTANIENNILILENGFAPRLDTKNTTVLTGIEIGGNN